MRRRRDAIAQNICHARLPASVRSPVRCIGRIDAHPAPGPADSRADCLGALGSFDRVAGSPTCVCVWMRLRAMRPAIPEDISGDRLRTHKHVRTCGRTHCRTHADMHTNRAKDAHGLCRWCSYVCECVCVFIIHASHRTAPHKGSRPHLASNTHGAFHA